MTLTLAPDKARRTASKLPIAPAPKMQMRGSDIRFCPDFLF
jgi:hypothetical protein